MTLPPFRNESYTDFSTPENRAKMQAALVRVRAQLGRTYGQFETPDKLISTNPANPKEIIGIHSKATPDMAARAVETAYANFPKWSRTPAEVRIGALVKTATLLRERKLDFNAWLVLEAGKTWAEAEA